MWPMMSSIAEGVGLIPGMPRFAALISGAVWASLWQHEEVQVLSIECSGWIFCTVRALGSLSVRWPSDTWASSHADPLLPCVFKVWPRKSTVPRRADATSVPQPLTFATVCHPPESLGSRSLTAGCPGSSYLSLCCVSWLGHLPSISPRSESPDFFHKRINNKYFRFWVPYDLFCNYLIVPLQCKWAQLCFNKTLFAKASGGPDLAQGPISALGKHTPFYLFKGKLCLVFLPIWVNYWHLSMIEWCVPSKAVEGKPTNALSPSFD